MKLAQLQSEFFEWVEGADAFADAEVNPVVSGGALEPSSRVGLYAEMYWLRMRDTLRDDFAAVREAVGDEAFDGLVAGYLKQYPSRHFSLGRLGDHFASYLEARAHPSAPAAALEWAKAQAFVAPETPVAKPSSLAVINEQTFAAVVLEPVASLRLAGRTAVWRKGLQVFHVDVALEEAQALGQLLSAAPARLAALCEPFTEPSAAFTAIASWVNEGMISSVALASPG